MEIEGFIEGRKEGLWVVGWRKKWEGVALEGGKEKATIVGIGG